MPTYDPSQVSISVGPVIAIARGESTFVKASRSADAFDLKMSSDGLGVFMKNPDKSGMFEITLLGSSPTNDDLQAIATDDENDGSGIVAVSIEDLTGTAVASAAQARIKKIPDLERQKEVGEVTWQIITPLLKLQQGGTTAD